MPNNLNYFVRHHAQLLIYISVFVIILLFMYARNISTTVRSHFMLRPLYVLNKHKWVAYEQNVTRLSTLVSTTNGLAQYSSFYRRDVTMPWFSVTWLIRWMLASAFVQLFGARNSLLSITNTTRHSNRNSHMNWSHASSQIHACQPNSLQIPLYLRYISGGLNLSCVWNIRLLHEQPFTPRCFNVKLYVFFAHTV